MKKVQTQKKPIDILVNNASIFITGDAVTEDGLEVWLDRCSGCKAAENADCGGACAGDHADELSWSYGTYTIAASHTQGKRTIPRRVDKQWSGIYWHSS